MESSPTDTFRDCSLAMDHVASSARQLVLIVMHGIGGADDATIFRLNSDPEFARECWEAVSNFRDAADGIELAMRTLTNRFEVLRERQRERCLKRGNSHE